MSTAASRDELLDLIDDYLDERIVPADADRLHEILRHDDQARLIYIEYLDLFSEILRAVGHQGNVRQAVLEADSGPGLLRWFMSSTIAALTMSACVVIALAIGIVSLQEAPKVAKELEQKTLEEVPIGLRPQETTPVLGEKERLVESWMPPAAAWIESGEALALGDENENAAVRTAALESNGIWPGDRLELTGDHLIIRFASGARCYLASSEAVPHPQISITSTNSCEFAAGTMMCRVPREASGFKVRTPGGELIDLGTEFGVDVNVEGDAELHVMRGSVAARKTAGSDTVSVNEGNAVRVATSTSVIGPIPFMPRLFARPAAYLYGIEMISPKVVFHAHLPTSAWQVENEESNGIHLVLEGTGVSAGQLLKFNSLLSTHLEDDKKLATTTAPRTFSLSAGQPFDSYLVATGKTSGELKSVEGEIRFARPALAVVTQAAEMSQIARIVRNDQVVESYDTVETVGGKDDDLLQLSEDGRTLRFRLTVRTNDDYFRVLVSADSL
ncbi:hypothetical protein SH661x_002836 [Planctomicrobium sp. SH661]|uniref:hypothetical protein n=1 Tax=Planctomicrobium sp. SH661 TaxID=3448124 RepID=UPI003F5B2F91